MNSKAKLNELAISDPATATILSLDTEYPRLYIEALPQLQQLFTKIRSQVSFPISYHEAGHALINLGIATTGNNTQRSSFLNCFNDDEFISFNPTTEVKSVYDVVYSGMSEERKKAIKLVHVHATCPIHKVLGLETAYVSFLRNPINSFMSSVVNALREDYGDDVVRDPKILCERSWPQIEQTQRSQKGRQLFFARFFLCFQDGVWDNVKFWSPDVSKYVDISDDELIEMSEGVITEHFPIMGITEYFSESLFVLLSSYGVNRIPLWKQEHRSGAPSIQEIEDLDPGIIEAVKDIMRVDIELYNRQKTNFETRFAPYLEALKKVGLKFDIDNSESLVELLNVRTKQSKRQNKAGKMQSEELEASGETHIFLHLLKTGGNALRHYFSSSMPMENMAIWLGDEAEAVAQTKRIRKMSAAEQDRVKVVFGHFAGKLRPYFPDSKNFTVIREPFARLISQYIYERRNAEALDIDPKTRPILGEVSMPELCKSILDMGLKGQGGNFNLQARTIAHYFGEDPDSVKERDLPAFIEEFDIIGLQEHFAMFLFLLHGFHKYPLKPVPLVYSFSDNVSGYFPKWLMSECRKYGHVDFRLYELAKEKFDKDVNRLFGASVEIASKWEAYRRETSETLEHQIMEKHSRFLADKRERK
jgi:hypothetical protein